MTAAPQPPQLRVEVRPLDDPDVVALRHDHAAEMRQRYGGGDMKPLDPADFEPPDGGFLVALLGEVAVGCAGFRRLTAGVAEVKSVRVSAGHRRLGIGRRLMAEVEAAATRAGYRELWLETGIEQPAALAMYADLGYRAIAPYGEFKHSPRSRSLARTLG